MKKRSSILIILFICLVLVTGCNDDDKVISNGKKVNTSKMQVMHCSRTGTAGTGMDVELKYDLYYTGDDLNILHSIEKVKSKKAENLDQYEEAYKKIHSNYEGLEYYDAKVERDETSVTSDITINYEKIDIAKLLEIEGEEDNIIKDGKAKVNEWVTLAKKFGAECEKETEES